MYLQLLLLHADGRTDGQIDRQTDMKLKATFRTFAGASAVSCGTGALPANLYSGTSYALSWQLDLL
jgi:hypothetical protein